MNELTQGQLDDLEILIDRTSLDDVIYGLVAVCQEKAEHLRDMWQDEAMAETWDHAANLLTAVARKTRV